MSAETVTGIVTRYRNSNEKLVEFCLCANIAIDLNTKVVMLLRPIDNLFTDAGILTASGCLFCIIDLRIRLNREASLRIASIEKVIYLRPGA